MNGGVRGAMAALLLLATAAAQALTVTSLSPQGEVAQVRQVVAQFDGPAVRLGDAQAAAPFTVACSVSTQIMGSLWRWPTW